MIKKSQFIFVLLLVYNSIHSQEKYLPVKFITNTSNSNDGNYLPLKNYYNIEEIYGDNIFNSVISDLNLNFSEFKFVHFSDIVRFRDSLIANKTSYKERNIEIYYNNSSKNKSTKSQTMIRLYMDRYPKKYKLLSCYRTTKVDDQNNYIISFSYLE